MSKITVLEAKTYQGKPSGFKVTLDNGTTGNMQEKESDKGLRVGDEVNVTLIPYTSKAGVTSNLLGLRLVNGGQVSGQVGGQATPPVSSLVTPPPARANVSPLYSAVKSIKEMKHESRLKVLETLGILAAAGKIEPKDIIEFYNEFYPALDLSYDVLDK
jgi:hypothetical protein